MACFGWNEWNNLQIVPFFGFVWINKIDLKKVYLGNPLTATYISHPR